MYGHVGLENKGFLSLDLLDVQKFLFYDIIEW